MIIFNKVSLISQFFFYIGNDYVSILKLLPVLFQPITIRLNNKRNKDCMPSVWSPSKVEQAATFITFITVSFIFESKLKNKWIKIY